MLSSAKIARELLPSLELEKHYAISAGGVSLGRARIKTLITSESPTQAELDTATITPYSLLKESPKNKTYIIKFCGNYNQYEESMAEFATDAKTLNAEVIAFNYRGVGHSTSSPETFMDLVTDGITQVQNLLDQKVPPNNIFLHGYSIGGAVATKVAEYFFNRGMILTLIHERSLHSISAAAEGIVRDRLPGLMALIPATIRVFGLSLALQWYGWEIDVTEAFLKHPLDRKLLLAVCPENWSGGRFGDGVIIHEASLMKKVKDVLPQEICIELDTKNSPDKIGHALPLTLLFNKANMNQTGKEVVNDFITKTVSSLRK